MTQNKNIGSNIKKGVIWSTVDFAFKAGFQLLMQIVLARLLLPEDFGLVGMAVVFTSVTQAFVDFGMGAALIQMKEEDLTEGYLNTAYWTGLFLNLVVYLTLALVIGPLSSQFYEEPRLIYIFPILSLNIIVNSFNVIQLVKLTRKLDFRSLALINGASNFIALIISVLLAFNGFGVWSLVIYTPLIAILALPMYLFINRWIPKMHWKKSEFRKIFTFGMYTSGTQLANSLTSQSDYLLIGKILNAQQLGVYSLAFQMTNVVKSKIIAIIAKVMYPIYAKLQDDKERIRAYYAQIIKFNMLLISPIMIILIVHAKYIILTLFSDKWMESIPIIQLLSFASIIQVFGSSNTSLIRAMGYPKLEFKIQLYKTIGLYLPSIFIGTYFYGILGAAYAILFNAFASIIIAMYIMNKLVKFTYGDLYKSTIRTSFIIIGAVSLDYFFQYQFRYEILSIIAFSLFYAVASFYVYNKDFRVILKK